MSEEESDGLPVGFEKGKKKKNQRRKIAVVISSSEGETGSAQVGESTGPSQEPQETLPYASVDIDNLSNLSDDNLIREF